MRKVFILSPAHPLRGGIAASTERLALEFQKEGVSVSIYSFALQYPQFLFPGKTQYSTSPPPKGLHILSVLNSINPLNWIKWGWKIRKQKPDLIVVRFWLPFMGPSLGTILKLVRGNNKTKIIAITDNIIPHEKRIGDRFFTKYFINSVDAFVVMSKSVEKDIRQFTLDKPVSFIPHPIYDNYGEKIERAKALQYLQLPEERRYILFFGLVRAYKGLDLLLKAMADCRIKDLDIHLIIAGEYYESKEVYEEIIHKHSLSQKVVNIPEFIPDEEVKYYFAAADLITQPYKTATQSGISQIAYHFEKPILVTRVGGLPEIVENGKVGYVVEVKVKAIADAIVDFFENQRSQSMIEEVQLAKERFSWKNLVSGINQLAQLN